MIGKFDVVGVGLFMMVAEQIVDNLHHAHCDSRDFFFTGLLIRTSI